MGEINQETSRNPEKSEMYLRGDFLHQRAEILKWEQILENEVYYLVYRYYQEEA